ncbi:hypothetical protein O3P69_014427 [Scylla paramamosain]|uniref:Uncharacterized protein n=1 Tax=Scylla paramamosain TaxID=85552 RepID=A0AAW0TB48_SCYPA
MHPRLAVTLATHAMKTPEELGIVAVIVSQMQCPTIFLLNNPTKIPLGFIKELEESLVPMGISFFHVSADNQRENVTQTYLWPVVDNVRQMGDALHCLMLVVVSDDPAFLAAFAHLSLRRHALRWSTRILVLTRLPFSHLDGLHGLLSNKNAMLLRVQGETEKLSVGVHISTPYSPPTNIPRNVATWTANARWTAASSFRLFPEKFLRFNPAPTLTVAIEQMAQSMVRWVEDPAAPKGRRLTYSGPLDECIKFYSKGMNFTYKYTVSPERIYGGMLPNGSWTGLMGMLLGEDAESGVYREVADLEKEGRLAFHTQGQLVKTFDTLVRTEDHVLVEVDITIWNLLAMDFSQKGTRRVLALRESGLMDHWTSDIPNSTKCITVPEKLLITTAFSVSSLWGVFVVLASGVAASLMVWVAELLIRHLQEY